MSRIWFSEPLETTALFWRILRRDGIALGFTTHDKNLWLDGILHRASPGMVPSAIRKSADLEEDSAEVRGSLTHDTLSEHDLNQGRFDAARVHIGLVDWETLESHVLYTGTLGDITQSDGGFAAQLASIKADLWRDSTPRTSPTCRARFGGPGCNINPQSVTLDVVLTHLDTDTNSLAFASPQDAMLYAGGELRWLDGPQTGLHNTILGPATDMPAPTLAHGIVLEQPLESSIPIGTRARLRQGCDHTLTTCASRFGNAINFQGEPFLPGNDLLTRYPAPKS